MRLPSQDLQALRPQEGRARLRSPARAGGRATRGTGRARRCRLGPALVTLALLPRSQWQGLVHLDAIKVLRLPVLAAGPPAETMLCRTPFVSVSLCKGCAWACPVGQIRFMLPANPCSQRQQHQTFHVHVPVCRSATGRSSRRRSRRRRRSSCRPWRAWRATPSLTRTPLQRMATLTQQVSSSAVCVCLGDALQGIKSMDPPMILVLKIVKQPMEQYGSSSQCPEMCRLPCVAAGRSRVLRGEGPGGDASKLVQLLRACPCAEGLQRAAHVFAEFAPLCARRAAARHAGKRVAPLSRNPGLLQVQGCWVGRISALSPQEHPVPCGGDIPWARPGALSKSVECLPRS